MLQTGADNDNLLERGGGGFSGAGVEASMLPPAFTDELTSIEFEMSDIRRKMTQLQSLHSNHLR